MGNSSLIANQVREQIQARFAEIVPGLSFYVLSSPVLLFLLAMLVILMAGAFQKTFHGPSVVSWGIGVVTAATATAMSFFMWSHPPEIFLARGYIVDGITTVGFAVISMGVLVTLIAASRSVSGRSLLRPEMCSLLMAVAAGMMVQIAAGDFLTFFVGLELMSIPLYVLVGYLNEDTFSLEAALKYFLMGAAASAVFLFGIALLSIYTGSLSWESLRILHLGSNTNPIVWTGLLFVLAGFAFKLALFPFHSWAPDVYQGTHALLAGLMSSLVKLTAALVLGRIIISGIGDSSIVLASVFWVLGAASIILGSIFGLVHNSIKRILAYSSIANAGYFCLALASLSLNPHSAWALRALLAGVGIYSLMTIGAFTLVAWIEDGHKDDVLKEELAGLGFRYPFVGAMFTLLLFGMAGVPPLAGFFNKYFLVSAAMEEGFIGLSIILMVMSAFSAYFYLSIMIPMWFKPADENSIEIKFPDLVGMKVVVLGAILGIFLMGFFGPRWSMDFTFEQVFGYLPHK